ncbi:MAG TPA: protoporphyrinogen oxidase [Micromonosporaceae bacterium]|jgi:oxygen-dependent protoporphyrinogen oxidase
MSRVVVVGGGIAGLAAAHRLREIGPDLEIVLLERAERLGGKIRTLPFVGQPIETGAETFLMRDGPAQSAALALAQRLGLGDALVHPAPVPAALAIDGALVAIPGGTLMGIPADPGALTGVAAVSGEDTDSGRPLLRPGEDVAVGALVRSRLGDEVVARLVDPLLGGVYAGRADTLSLQATMPGLHRSALACNTLGAAVREALRAAPRPAGTPAFATVHGGLSQLVEAVAAASRARVELGQTVRGLTRVGSGWRVRTGAAGRESALDADAVVLAVPGAPAGRLLSSVDADAAAAVGRLEYASMALVTLALPADTALPELSGFLVPAEQGYAVKAATFFTTKWPHLRRAAVIVRASLGRHGSDEDVLALTDAALIDRVRCELPRLVGAPVPAPSKARVNRWGGGLPQYGVGHTARVAAARAGLPPSLELAGAAYDGVGIAACVRSGEAAAQRVREALPA